MTQTPELIAEYKNIRYGQHKPLLHINSVLLHRNRCLVLRGANGSGKSTLLLILAFLLKPLAMDVHIAGRKCTWSHARARLASKLVYLHQAPYLFDCTVRRNVEYGLWRARVGGTVRERRVREALAWGGIAHLAERNARRLSGGEVQCVALARARAVAPELLLLDEPTTHLDHDARLRTYSLINSLRDEGASVVIASHDALHDAFAVDGYMLLHNRSLLQCDSDPLLVTGDTTGINNDIHGLASSHLAQ